MAAAGTLAGASVRPRRFELGEAAFAYLLNAPAILTVLLLVAYPIVDAFWLSLHRYNLRRPDTYAFVGLQNYLDVLKSDLFLPSLGVTLLFTFWSTIGVLLMALIIALVANEQMVGVLIPTPLLEEWDRENTWDPPTPWRFKSFNESLNDQETHDFWRAFAHCCVEARHCNQRRSWSQTLRLICAPNVSSERGVTFNSLSKSTGCSNILRATRTVCLAALRLQSTSGTRTLTSSRI